MGGPRPQGRRQLPGHRQGTSHGTDKEVLGIFVVSRRDEVPSEPPRKEALVDLLFVNREGFAGD